MAEHVQAPQAPKTVPTQTFVLRTLRDTKNTRLYEGASGTALPTVYLGKAFAAGTPGNKMPEKIRVTIEDVTDDLDA